MINSSLRRVATFALSVCAVIAVAATQFMPYRMTDEQAVKVVGGCGPGGCNGTYSANCGYDGDGCGIWTQCAGDSDGTCMPVTFCTSFGCNGPIYGSTCQ